MIRPFVKWAGGKSRISNQILSWFPGKIERYYEPFAGGGGLYFSSHNKIREAILSDINEELITTYRIVKKEVEPLIDLLREHQGKHNKRYYMEMRADDTQDPLKRAARFIYLNKTCYNGLYRVNKKGEFNVPIGSYDRPTVCDDENLRACSRVLQKAKIPLKDFREIIPESGSLIYCDPPYDGTYNQYASGGFTEGDQRELRDKALEWYRDGSKVFLSNSDTELIRDLYPADKFEIVPILSPRSINSDGEGRGKVQELLLIVR